MRKFTLITAAFVLFAGIANAQVIPVKWHWDYAYQYPVKDYSSVIVRPGGATTTNPAPNFSDLDGSGYVSVSVFDDGASQVYVQIPNSQYADMGKADDGVHGISANPTYTQYQSILDALTTKAKAAIAFDTFKSTGSGAPATSVTTSYTTTGSNVGLFIGVLLNSATATATSTYNGVQSTIVSGSPQAIGLSNQTFVLYNTVASGVTANVVVNFSASVSNWGYSVDYTDVSQSCPIDAVNNFASTTVGDVTAFVTPVASNDWTILWGTSPNNTNGLTADTGSTQRSAAGDGNAWFDSAGTVTAGTPHQMNFLDGATDNKGAQIIAIAPVGTTCAGGGGTTSNFGTLLFFGSW